MKTSVAFCMVVAMFAAVSVVSSWAKDDDQLGPNELQGVLLKHAHVNPHNHSSGKPTLGIPNIDSIVDFSGEYVADGVDPNGNPNRHWLYTMIGNAPQKGGTTAVNAPIVPVSLQLLNTDGSPRFVNGVKLFFDASPYVQPALNSPMFQTFKYSSSEDPTQFADALMRAEFFHHERKDWHTLLLPSVKTPRVMNVPRGSYRFALNPDGSCCFVVEVDYFTFVNLLFPSVASDTTTPVGAAENAGDITTKDLSTFLFPPVYLTIPGRTNTVVAGFHTYDFEPGDSSNGNLEKRYVVNYSAWDAPGFFFDPNVVDITSLSHEISEAFNNPFVNSDGVHNVTPWWLAPNGLCQNNLEVGDVIEGLPNQTFPITLNGTTYHPQNEALLQWFEFEKNSSAIDQAYSYPDTTVLTQLSPVENAGCQ